MVSLIPVGGRGINVTADRQSTRTDAEGAYSFASVTPGNYLLRAEHSGFVGGSFTRSANPAGQETLAVGAGQTLDKIDIRLLASGVISGTVFDEDNQPMEGVMVAAIRLTYQRGGQQQEQQLRNVMTDDLGDFRLYGLPSGSYFVRAQNPNANPITGGQTSRSAYYPGSATIESAQKVKVNAGNESSGIRFAIVAQTTYTITGNVLDSGETSGPKRYIVSAAHVGSSENLSGTSTANDGSFTIRGAPSGEYVLTAVALQISPTGGNILIAPNANSPQRVFSGTVTMRVADADARVNIPIGPSAEVDGKIAIENSSGQSVQGIRVVLQHQSQFNGAGANIYNAATDLNGLFKIQNVQTGSYLFSAAGRPDMYLKQVVCNGRDETFQALTIDSGATIGDCSLTLGTDTGKISGQVYDGDKPVLDEVVVAIPQSLSLRQVARYTVTGNTNASGEFSLNGIIPGDYVVFAVPKDDEQMYFQIDFADRNQRDAERVTVHAGDTKTLTLKPSTPQ